MPAHFWRAPVLLNSLPSGLEDGPALLKRREAAATRKEMWRDTYRECYEYTMPQRETFNWYAPGQRKTRHLYDSTGQEATYLAANNMQALLCPAWRQWASLVPGGLIPQENAEDHDLYNKLQDVTRTVFHYINHSNFATVIPEVLLDLMVGTGALCIDEGEPDDPLVFDAIPLSLLELEEGPNGRIETVWMARAPLGRNLTRMYRGLTVDRLPDKVREKVQKKPDEPVKIVQGVVYDPKTRHYFGVVVDESTKALLWRYDYDDSSPYVVARASVVSGEIYGRGRVMVALPDIKTLNKMQEFLLDHSAAVVAPPMTAVSDGILNPYTAQFIPNSIIPVASNASNNPSLMPLEVGGNFAITDAIMQGLRESVRRVLLGAQQSEGPIKSATEIAIADRNRLWDMGAEFGRIQAELLSKVVARCVFILQKQGKIPPIKVDGKQITLKYVSPLARAQDQEDLLAFDQTLDLATKAALMMGEAGAAAMAVSFKAEEIPGWLTRRTGGDADLVRTEAERRMLAEQMQAAQAGTEAA